MVAAFGDIKQKLMGGVRRHVPKAQVVDLLFDEEREAVLRSDATGHLDFFCPAFPKCGTTSQHVALSRNPRIFLSVVEETAFLRYEVNESTHLAHYPMG